MVHSSQVKALEADTGHPVFYLLRPQLRRLLLLLDQPWKKRKEDTRGKVSSRYVSSSHMVMKILQYRAYVR